MFDDQQLTDFRQFTQAKPEEANVEDITFEEYCGSFMSIEICPLICSCIISQQTRSIRGYPTCFACKQEKMLDKLDWPE